LNLASLFCFRVSGTAIDAKKCYVTGRGVQQNGIRVGDVAEFTVHTDGAGDGELKVSGEGPGGKDEPIRVKKVCRFSIKSTD
jgi:filamin